MRYSGLSLEGSRLVGARKRGFSQAMGAARRPAP